MILVIVYLIASYWAISVTVYANRIIFGDFIQVFLQKFFWGMLFGWILIPIAIIKTIIENR